MIVNIRKRVAIVFFGLIFCIIWMMCFTLRDQASVYNMHQTYPMPWRGPLYGILRRRKNLQNYSSQIRTYWYTPLCENILHNITNGQWIKKIYLLDKNDEEYTKLIKQEKELDAHLTEFRIKRGIHTRLWREDGKCGFKNTQDKPRGNAWAAPAGSWCDAKSERPCCSNLQDGECGNECNCSNCIDMREIYHAEVSEWVPFDSSCRQRNYTADEACKVTNRFDQIYFIGDSFVRKMARGFILTLRSDPTYGFLLKRYDEEMKKSCVGLDQFYWTECRTAGSNVLDELADGTAFCGNDTPLIEIREYSTQSSATDFLNLVRNLIGKIGTVILVGQGGHDGCKSKITINNFFNPAVQYIEEYYRKFNNTTDSSENIFQNARWPHIIFMYPDSNGILKPRAYHASNGDIVCREFSYEMGTYCGLHNIPILDFSSLTSGVHSYDGTHHGLGVNIMKVQLMLNYLDSISNALKS